ncbi:MAG: hypothetical protein ACE5GC_05845 [Acidimicrobiia bacterium]
MTRKLGTTIALVIVMLGLPAANGQSTVPSVQQPPDPEQTAPIVLMGLGSVFEGMDYDLSVSRSLAAESPTLAGVTEIRLDVSFRNGGESVLPMWTPGIDGPGLPSIVVRDATGVLHEVDAVHPARAGAPGAAVRVIAPGGAVRWTLGFQIPTAASTNGAVLALVDGSPVAGWQLGGQGTDVVHASPPLQRVRLGETILWEPGLSVTARATGSLVCGDPAIEPVAHIFAVTFDVSNANTAEARWPRFSLLNADPVVQWADGTAARMSIETFWGDVETLPRVSGEMVRIPPLTEAARALVFSAPRDGRFTNVDTLPQGVRLPTADGEVWLDLTGVAPSVGIDPTLCDLGGAGAPVPYAFGPGPKFQIGGEPAPGVRAAADEAAQTLLTSAVSAAARFYDGNGESLARLDETAFGNLLTLALADEIRAGTDNPAGTLGTVYFDRDPGRRAFLFVATRSASGTWFCSAGDLFIAPSRAAGGTLGVAGRLCWPEKFAVSSS